MREEEACAGGAEGALGGVGVCVLGRRARAELRLRLLLRLLRVGLLLLRLLRMRL